MLLNIQLLLFLLVNAFNVCRHRNDATLVPDALEDVRLLAVIFLELDVFWGRWVTGRLIEVADCYLDLLEHIRQDEAYFLRVIIGIRWE